MLLAAMAATGVSSRAQVLVGTLGAATADRARGLAAPQAGPVLRAGASIDAEAGAWAGAYASGLLQYQLRDARWGRSQWLAGWSRPLAGGWAWDTALSRTLFARDRDYDYGEAMAGLVHREAALRAWWAPRYDGGRDGALYLEAEGGRGLGGPWRLIGHLGRLSVRGQGTRVDALAGVAWSRDALACRLTVDGLVAGRAPAGAAPHAAGPAVTLAATWAY